MNINCFVVSNAKCKTVYAKIKNKKEPIIIEIFSLENNINYLTQGISRNIENTNSKSTDNGPLGLVAN